MPGPSTTTTVVPLRIPNEEARRLDELAARLTDFPTRTALARVALRRGLDLIEAEYAERSSPAKPTGSKRRKPPAPALALAAFELPTFAGQVLDAARGSQSGRFGQDRIFISHVWKAFQRLHPDAGLTDEQFKERLVEANRARLVSLVCADMAPVLDQGDVQASKIRYLSATFHFLCL